MRSFTRTLMKLVVIFVCLALISCGPTRTRTTAEGLQKTGADGRVDVGSPPLSREQIFAVANTAARKRGWKLEEFRVFFDEDNAIWRSGFSGIRIPEVDGHNFQVVIYRRRPTLPAEDRLVIVDKDTGEVLMSIGEGQVEVPEHQGE